jgi:Domain of Unknown Function with PDB structure (DUF3857)/Transglutaminase-like superfamily
MKNRFSCNRTLVRRPISQHAFWVGTTVLTCILGWAVAARAADAPQWMHAVVNAPLPSHDEKTDAILLYSETNVNVISADKIKTVERRVYKILRPEGRHLGTAVAYFNSPGEKINWMRGWCIPVQGKDYEVKDKEALEVAPPGVEGGELVSDERAKLLRIPAPDPGNIVGYEYEVESNPLVLMHDWDFQHSVPVREAHYSLHLPPGWEYKESFLNYPEVKPTQSGTGQWDWTVTDVKAIREEEQMPPWKGLAGKMIVYFLPPGGPGNRGFSDWRQMGTWYWNLEVDRVVASDEIRKKVTDLTSSARTPVEKMHLLAAFVQNDIRYVAIELGIGGWQPHPASAIFSNRYGDCKDKTNLFRSMLHEIGIESYVVAINTVRGSVTPQTPAYHGFNHEITAIKLPDNLEDPTLIAVVQHPKLGKLLFFDPTDEVTPFGQIRGHLQANYGLLVTLAGGELVELPKQASAMNSIRRTGKLSIDALGNLHGDVEETRLGDRAASERWRLRSVTTDRDRIKPIESLLAGSLSNFQILKASVVNLSHPDRPFGFNYSFVADSYAKNAGGLLLLRPRVLGIKAEGILETKEPRQYPIEFGGPVLDTDNFEITLPPGYEVDDLPPPVDADFGFASYHSKTEVKGNVLAYSRTFEIKELSVPVSRAPELKKFYRIIASDERNTAILKPSKQ